MNLSKADILKKEQVDVTKRACNRFELISQDIKIPKLKYLHRSLNFKSNIHYNENEGKTYKYQKYKRGSVVMVNFGTNVGYELSGNHFAVVINQDDNYRNGVVTVIPLTSKEKRHYLKLDDSILELVMNAQNEYIDMLLDAQKLHDEHTREISLAMSNIEENFDKIKSIIGKGNESSLKYQDLLIKMLDENDKYIEKLKELNELTKKESNEIEENMDKLYLVLDKYNEKDKASYAMVKNIVTISKLKILKPINKFDPIGKIYISNSSLDKIDKEIINNFTFCANQSLDETKSNDI